MTRPDALRVAVAGAGGLAGGELLRLLLQHPGVGEITPLSRSQAGKPAHEAHPALRHLRPLQFSGEPVEAAARGADVLFFALGHGESQAVIPPLIPAGARLIDLAADFRLKDAHAYEKAYGKHSCFDLAHQFTYGLPEAFKDRIAASRLIANPGCFATAAELLLLPLAGARLLPPDAAVFGVTGSSGSGATPKPATHHPFRDGNLFAYKMLAHQHEPEINQTLSEAAGAPVRVRLLAHSGPFVRGIHAAAYFRQAALGALDVGRLYRDFYGENAPFVEVIDGPPALAEVVGSNYVHIGVFQKDEEVQLALVLDNLVKGAAGQAIQNMNLMAGFPETEGLTHPGAYPC